MKLELIIWIVIFLDMCTGEKTAKWSQWTDVTPCTKTCGTGTKIQTRNCIFPSTKGRLNEECLGPFTQAITCNTKRCTASWKVLVALGGKDVSNPGPGTFTNDVEIIDLLSPNTKCQKPANFPKADFFITGGLGFQGKPLICGGSFDNAACYKYDAGVWSSSNVLNTPRSGARMIKSPFQDGSTLFIVGGNGVSSTEVLTPNGWQMSVPVPIKIAYHGIASINSTSIMVFGGYQNGGGEGAATFTFNSVNNVWTQGPQLSNARHGVSCGLINRDSHTEVKSVICAGGYSGIFETIVEVLDTNSTTWRRGPDLPIGICCGTMVEDPSGGVVMIGGQSGSITLGTIFRLPNSGPGATWVEMPQKLKTPRYWHTSFIVPDELANCY